MAKPVAVSSLPPINTGTRIRRQRWSPAAIEFAKGLPEGAVTVAMMAAIEARLAELFDIYSDQ